MPHSNDPKTPRYDVFGLGQCCLDYLGTTATFPLPDRKCELDSLLVQGGGPVATALVALARWGARCVFQGLLGDDPVAAEIRAELKREGVDTEPTIVRECSASQIAFIVAEPGAGRRTIFWRRPTGAAPTPAEVASEVLLRARLLHTDGLFAEASLHAATLARRNGLPVVVDAGTLRDGSLELARRSDFFIASETFGQALVGADDPVGACRRIAELGPRLTVVTLGARGYVACENGRCFEWPAYPVAAIDTTGCGDIFHGGFIHGLLHGWSTETALDYGAWAAACCATRTGGRTAIPDAASLPERFRLPALAEGDIP